MFNNEFLFYDFKDGLYVECKYCYLEENDKTMIEVVNIDGCMFIDIFQQCKYCGNTYYRDKQVNRHLRRYKKAKFFDKIRWI